MIHSLIRWLRGYVKIRVEGYSPERFLNMCCFHHIFIWGLAPVQGAYEMYMTVSGFKKIRPLAKKTKTKVSLKERCGLPFFLFRYRRRKALFAGILLCIILLKVYSLFIWDIHFEGNEKWTDETLIEFLASKGVTPCMLKNKVDCPAIVKDIRKEYNDIVWVSASIDGSRLKVQIKENEDRILAGNVENEKEHPTDLIASDDGVITAIVTRSGVPQVHAGDEVKAGDVLVLGRVEVLNDSGEVTGYEYCQADADVYADTQMPYSDSMPLTYQEKIYEDKEKIQFYAKIFGWDITVGSVKNNYKNSERFTWERRLKMGENFELPFSFGYRKVRCYSFQEKNYTKKELQERLSGNFSQFCEDLEEKGVQIRDNSVKIQLDKNSAAASGTLFLNQSITEEADTEILTIERKEQDESVGTDD